ncbi:unnamed protein product [Mytilus coruscus]|uniref:Uncharacterized protein n=1 Tax=Mytilus coruscus TaxID=42192 RepID=A0A6J8D5V9_MYTCO|nr:unnamed protein product [Mytilus coruscus]
MKSSDEGYKMLGKNIPFFHEVNALPIPLDIRRLNDGEGIESTMKKKNAKYHNLSRKFNNTNLERAQKRHMSPIPSGRSSESVYPRDRAKKSQTEAESNCTQYENMMKETALAKLVHSTRLKDKLLQKMPELEAHTKGRDVLLMFEKDIGPAIAFAYDYIDTMHMEKTAEMIRCQSGCLPLAIETGRYTKPKTLLNDQKCKYCTVDCVEDEKHVVMHCEFYSDLRYGLFLKACAINPNFNDFDDDDKFIFLMSDDSIQPFLAKSLYFMFNHRKYCV